MEVNELDYSNLNTDNCVTHLKEMLNVKYVIRHNIRKNITQKTEMNSRNFLQICHRGEYSKLCDIIHQNNGIFNWVNYRHNMSGDTGLHLAAQKGHVNIVKILCKYSENSNCHVDVMNVEGKRPLHDAAQFAKVDIVQILIEEGAVVNTFKRGDWTPLMLACTKKGPEAKACIEVLLKAKADPFLRNKDGWTAFLIACRTGDCDIINLYLHEFAPKCIDDRSNNGRTALHISAFHGHLDVVDLLVPRYLHLLKNADSSGSTPLHESVKSQNIDVTKKLIELGADVDAVDNAGQTILHVAALVGNINVLDYVLENKLLNVESKDFLGITPLMISQENKLHNVVEILQNFYSK